jgi:L-lysine exporter family protein LysE/ArgO
VSSIAPAPMSPVASAFTQGWLLMAGLIVAIGAQNALVLRQGLRREHLGPVIALCASADALLVAAGVFGLGAALAGSPVVLEALRLGGAAFLGAFALRSGWRAWRGDGRALAPPSPADAAGRGRASSLASTLSATLAITFLNPHVYLDTVVLVGVVGAHLPAAPRGAFAAGAALASLMWFLTLGLGARALAPTLQRPAVWRGIEAVIAVVMATVAFQLWWRPL